MVVAQLAEGSLPIPEISVSNPDIGIIMNVFTSQLLSRKDENKEKEAGNGPIKKWPKCTNYVILRFQLSFSQSMTSQFSHFGITFPRIRTSDTKVECGRPKGTMLPSRWISRIVASVNGSELRSERPGARSRPTTRKISARTLD